MAEISSVRAEKGSIRSRYEALSLHGRFAVAGSIVMLIGSLIIGWWVGSEIEQSVTRNSAISTALYMESFIAPLSQELGSLDTVSSPTAEKLRSLFSTQPLSDRIKSVKIWKEGGLVAFASDSDIIGKRFEPTLPLKSAWRGELSAAFDDLNDPEDASERRRNIPLLEVYNPIHSIYTGDIIAVAEFYQIAEELERDLFAARFKSWLLVGIVTAATFALLFGIVRQGSRLIQRQRQVLEVRLNQLSRVSAQNEALRKRVLAASAGVSELNERYLKRISAELHDGPAQSVAFASMRMDSLLTSGSSKSEAPRIKAALDEALAEIRQICRGLSLPEIEGRPLNDVVETAVRAHERRTGTDVPLTIVGKCDIGVDQAARICVFRFVQEALNNAARHAAGCTLRVDCHFGEVSTTISVSDNGPGFDPELMNRQSGLGLRGLRERIESQGGMFRVNSKQGVGTTLEMTLKTMERANHS